jgi:hypothetical protein
MTEEERWRCSSCGEPERPVDATILCLSCAQGVQWSLNARAGAPAEAARAAGGPGARPRAQRGTEVPSSASGTASEQEPSPGVLFEQLLDDQASPEGVAEILDGMEKAGLVVVYGWQLQPAQQED